eukprot:gnl/Hemi2/3947_TR1384_c0_g9_i1.p1 gnl/Hemi2/3947_TR1384_c0_g9~~gnl/Hemi2/3947_TR1384_c0_g9_i1.p1  ORF type:complete len:226 (-),score=56.11 gnl/Hemi2/3947_TR1384_c0_g9_i1:89-766(-)
MEGVVKQGMAKLEALKQGWVEFSESHPQEVFVGVVVGSLLLIVWGLWALVRQCLKADSDSDEAKKAGARRATRKKRSGAAGAGSSKAEQAEEDGSGKTWEVAKKRERKKGDKAPSMETAATASVPLSSAGAEPQNVLINVAAFTAGGRTVSAVRRNMVGAANVFQALQTDTRDAAWAPDFGKLMGMFGGSVARVVFYGRPSELDSIWAVKEAQEIIAKSIDLIAL